MDSGDWFALLCIILLLAGVAAIYWPACLILAGILGLSGYYLREFALVTRPTAQQQQEQPPG